MSGVLHNLAVHCLRFAGSFSHFINLFKCVKIALPLKYVKAAQGGKAVMDDHDRNVVLLVDDEPDMREMLALEFGRKGFVTCESADGEEAIKLLEARPVDAVVSDVRMPGLDGLELLDAIKSLDVHRPAVMLMSAYSDISPEIAYHRGAEAVFAKPFLLAGMVDAVRRLIAPPTERFGGICQEIPHHRLELHVDDFNSALDQGIFGMGRGGAHCALKRFCPRPNQYIEFSISMSDGPLKSITGYGVVRWVRRNGAQGMPPACGVEFLQLAETAREAFQAWTISSKPKAYIPFLHPC